MKLALQRLKYRNDVGLGATVGEQMAPWLRSQAWHIDVIVPVPLGKSRFGERGYNQAGLIAWPLAVTLELEYSANSLRRVLETRSQVGLTMQERRDNVRGAFSANSDQVSGKSVLLLDDVATTGSTLSSAAGALLAAGARVVFAATAARALPQRGMQDA